MRAILSSLLAGLSTPGAEKVKMLILIDLSVGIRPALLHHLCIRCAAVTLGPRMHHAAYLFE